MSFPKGLGVDTFQGFVGGHDGVFFKGHHPCRDDGAYDLGIFPNVQGTIDVDGPFYQVFKRLANHPKTQLRGKV